MGSVIRLKSRQRAQEEASAWLSRMDRGLTPPEQQQLHAWLKADPRHAAEFSALASTWDSLTELRALSGLVELPGPRQPRRVVPIVRRVGVAALIVAALGAGLWSTVSRVPRAPEGPAFTSVTTDPADTVTPAAWSTTLTTGTGQRRRFRLPDGSVIELNTRSTLRTALHGNARQVELLAGEATFNVAPDARRPFTVQAAGRRIRAVGTVFTVRAKSQDNVSVIVSEGRVAVSRAPIPAGGKATPGASTERSTRLLEAGDRLEMIGVQARFERLSGHDMQDALAWQDGMIVFQGETLVEALGEVSRYSDARFELADDSIGELRVAGAFRINDLDGFVDSLRANLGVGARELPDGILSLYRLEPAPG
jgi:transmembrane sensor